MDIASKEFALWNVRGSGAWCTSPKAWLGRLVGWSILLIVDAVEMLSALRPLIRVLRMGNYCWRAAWLS